MSELQDIHAGREVLYSLFYRVFIMTPESDLYTMLAELLSFMRQTAEGDEAAETAISKIEQFFIERERCAARKLNSSKAEFDLETQRRYTRLFCMTNSVRSCQSHYESENRLSRDEAYSQCLELYARYELPKDERYSEDADFIAEQLRFMSYMASLCAKQPASLVAEPASLITTQLDFIDNHLRWLDSFVAELSCFEEAQQLYLPLTEYMLSFIKADREFLRTL